jgi:prepilin signal peptidase PulO-like enzyme (type II secretory pathway)
MILFLVFSLVLGAIIGSFLNVVILRLHEGRSFARGRSACPDCHHVLSWQELIPIASFVFQGGRCRHCGKKISWQYPSVELATAILFGLAIWLHPQLAVSPDDWRLWLSLLRDWIFISYLVIIFVYDLRWYLILDKVTVPAIVTALALNLILGISWQGMLLAGVVGFVFFALQFVISKGKWIGGGDLRVGLLMGLMLSWPNILVGLLVAYVSGSVIGIGLVLKNKKEFGSKIPFGTFLAFGTIVALFWGQGIVSWYLRLIGF